MEHKQKRLLPSLKEAPDRKFYKVFSTRRSPKVSFGLWHGGMPKRGVRPSFSFFPETRVCSFASDYSADMFVSQKISYPIILFWARKI